ncbi:THAP domain-containing protein 2-like isoform X2 [Solenopsis invicta]|uniref:THAP domain-containing protein 2-like isoform X2 n=1 Tax=Solenopsis invicta TaxID=13686 RepID=UPI000595C692|nr:THAP domain-containing protein 2-like isoform X2 [Solenopsis invicta]
MFYNFPSDPDTRKKWLEIIKRDDNKKRFVCSQYFKPEDYRMLCNRRQLLRKDTVPNINIRQLDAKVQFIKNKKQNCEQFPMECHKDMDDNIEDNNIENVPREFATSMLTA